MSFDGTEEERRWLNIEMEREVKRCVLMEGVKPSFKERIWLNVWQNE